ncbi:MAG: CAP domain-containing protein [Acidimicrobiales bacterium]|nr:CAP domain-containing protein [Acidimicrobiales bacterium]
MNLVPDSPRRRNRRRLAFIVAAALTVLGSQLVQPAEPASASASDESAFVAALNQVRADNGLPPLTVNIELSNLAREHAQVMADAGEIFHANPISAGYTGEWAKLGENVGVGASVEVLMDAFVASSGHFANIVDPSFTEVGVGVVWRDAAMYTTHRFLQLPGAAPSTTTTTAPPTTAPPPTAPPTSVPASTVSPTAPLPAPPITAERVLALLALLDQVGT